MVSLNENAKEITLQGAVPSNADNPESVENRDQHMPLENRTCMQGLANIINNITVEPPALLMLTATLLSSMTSQNLALEKACRVNLNLSDAICDALKNQDSNETSEYERRVQQYVAGYISLSTIITSVLPAIILAFAGGWMDLTGKRKLMMMLPVLGELLMNTNSMINVIFFDQLSVEYLFFFNAFFSSIFGGSPTMFLATFSFIADITTEKNRTYRLGLVSFCTYVGMPIGLALSGIMLNQFGYYIVYGTSMSLHVLNFLYFRFVITEPKRSKEHKKHDGRGFCYFLKTFFDPSHIINTFIGVFKKTANNRRLILIILLITVCLLFGPMYGEISILYLSTRYRFNWDEVQFSVFQTYSFIIHTVGTMFSILVFSKKLQWNDSVLGIMSTISKIASSFVYGFAPSGKIFYFAPLVDILNGTSMLAIRSMFSKLVNADELGKVNSIVSLTENLMPLAYVPLYTTVYTSTMEVLPGAAFLLSSSMTLSAMFVFLWMFYRHRKSLKHTKKQNGAELSNMSLDRN